MVSTAAPAATEAGAQMLARGGNAVDAAVAAAFCLGVAEPQASGIGGQSMVLLALRDGTTVALDGSSRAPFAVPPGGVPGHSLKLGIHATTVPSTPAVLGYLLEHYGTMPLAEVLEPAIGTARKGFRVSALLHRLLSREATALQSDRLVNEAFFKNGRPLYAGETVLQPVLAACLERMAKVGWRDFYLGDIAAEIIVDMKAREGLVTEADLSQIPLPVEREPLRTTYRDREVVTFPPPGAGRALVQILSTLEQFTPEELTPQTPRWALILALTFRAALSDRKRSPADPALYPQEVNKWMLDKEYAQTIAKRIRTLTQWQLQSSYAPPPTSGETTHLSVADGEGNLVAITQSIELVFGAKTMAAGLGFFYNNYMSAFELNNMMHPYYLLPGARPWSSVAPTLLLRRGHPELLLGSPGSERISTVLSQVISSVVDAKMTLAEAVEAPRLHADSTGQVFVESRLLTKDVVDTLQSAGFDIVRRGAYSFFLGCVQAVQHVDKAQPIFTGVADPRRDGTVKSPTVQGAS